MATLKTIRRTNETKKTENKTKMKHIKKNYTKQLKCKKKKKKT